LWQRVTFEERTHPGPARDGARSVELTQGQLHEKQRDAAENQHQPVWY